ncbi:hypothetical protein [Campylobacter felis]|uniref:hypothetical protein n=1 Tax=Campylobacter felis TaxID=2974565 RepID=UPI00256378C6|nr:hypothetical protein [Campylobacter felis]
MSDEVREGLTPSKEDFYNELKELLKDNTKWVEQVKMSLELLVHLYDSFLKIENKYDTSLEEVGRIASQIRQEGLKIEALSVKMGEDFLELQEEARGILQNVGRIKDEITQAENNVANDKDDVRTFMQRVEALKSELSGTVTRLEGANIAEFVTLYGEKKAEITHTLEVARTQLEGYVNTNRTNLESQKEEILAEINRVKGELDRTDLESQKEQITSEINAVKQQILTEINAAKEEARAQLDRTDLESQKNEILAEINRVKEEARAQLSGDDEYSARLFAYISNHLNLPHPISDIEVLPEGDLPPNEEDV